MTTFEDGPAKGQTLMLQRAPRFLRVTQHGATFDALDLMGDVPKPEEKLFVYEIVGEPGRIHINRSGGRGGFFSTGHYRFVSPQPADADMRNFEAWCRWCHRQAELLEPVEL